MTRLYSRSAQMAELKRKLAAAEATLARVRELPARWRSLDNAFGTGEGDELLCADELEAALAGS